MREMVRVEFAGHAVSHAVPYVARWDFPRSEQWIRTNGINQKYPKIRSKGTATSKNGSQTVSSWQLRQCFSPSQMLQRSAVSKSENELLSFLFLGRFPYWIGFVWKCWVYSQWKGHLIGIMISKTIGFRGTQHFQTHPIGSGESQLCETLLRRMSLPYLSFSLGPGPVLEPGVGPVVFCR